MPRRKTSQTVQPWERQPKESTQAHQSFLVYRDLGPGRSLDRLANHAGLLGDGGRAPGRYFQWSRTHHWVSRASAWDAFIQAERDRVAVAEVKKWESRRFDALEANWQAAQALRVRLKQMLAFPIHREVSKDGKTIIEPGKWSFQTAAMIAKVVAEIEVAVLTAAGADLDQLTFGQARIFQDSEDHQDETVESLPRIA